ncbi:MAG TPA: hypothetical protein VKT82_28615 [Ktedonobacterales bacterium]|nr:hypothetical protein [Ktedonobacterales bacterium]
MPKKSESTNQPKEAPAEEPTPAPQQSPADAAGPGAQNGQTPQPALSGLRGAEYVKALGGQQLATIEVPLLPSERRGDWERAKGVKIRVTTRQLAGQEGASANPWLERAHALAALVIELQRPGATRFDQIDLPGSTTREAIERLSDYVNQARLRAQAQTGKKWTASQVYLVPMEDA